MVPGALWARRVLAPAGAPRWLLGGLRQRHNIMPHGKPPWMGVAPSKVFKLRRKDHTPPQEIEQMKRLETEYNLAFSATVQYLYEDYLRHSDVGEAAKQRQKLEEEEHKTRIEENEAENRKVAALREERRNLQLQQDKKRIESELTVHAEEERERLSKAERLVRRTEDAVANAIPREELASAIEAALDSPPYDPEFAIDLDGHIYYGRETRCSEVPADEKVKIPVPDDPDDFLRIRRANS